MTEEIRGLKIFSVIMYEKIIMMSWTKDGRGQELYDTRTKKA